MMPTAPAIMNPVPARSLTVLIAFSKFAGIVNVPFNVVFMRLRLPKLIPAARANTPMTTNVISIGIR